MPDIGASEIKPSSPKTYISDSSNAEFAYRRDDLVSEQPSFGTDTHDVFLLPIRAELSNGHLAHYLEQMNTQRVTHDSSIGILLLVNNHQYDSQTVVSENEKTAQFLNLLTTEDIDGINDLSIPEEYKKIGIQLIKDKKITIRYDYLTTTDGKHMGRLRDHLLELASQYTNETSDQDNLTVHFSDVDTHYRPHHVSIVEKGLQNGAAVNIAQTDYAIGRHETTPPEEDITREMISSFDSLRTVKSALRISSWMSGGYRSVTPTYAGKLSFFLQDRVRRTLCSEGVNDDYALGNLLRAYKNAEVNISNTGEIFVVDRAKTTRREPTTDAEHRYLFTKTGVVEVPIVDPEWKNISSQIAKEPDTPELYESFKLVRESTDDTQWDTFFQTHFAKLYSRLLEADKELPGAKMDFYRNIKTSLDHRKALHAMPEEEGYEYFGADYYPEEYGSEEEISASASLMRQRIASFDWSEIGVKTTYILPQETANFIQYIERLVQQTLPDHHNLSSDSGFQQTLNKEITHEQAKVHLRRNQLAEYIKSIKNSTALPDSHIFDLFTDTFQEIRHDIRARIEKNIPDEDIVTSIVEQFPDFFNPDSPIHTNIAHLKALESYMVKTNINIIANSFEYSSK